MSSIATQAGWSDEKSIEIAHFQATVSAELITDSSEECINNAINKIMDSKYTESDKRFIILSLGVLIGRIQQESKEGF